MENPVRLIRMQGSPQKKGWTLVYLSGDPVFHPGDVLTQVDKIDVGYRYGFGPEGMLVFDTEERAVRNSESLLKIKIKTEVVKVG